MNAAPSALLQAPAWSVIPDMPRHIPQRVMALHAGAFLRPPFSRIEQYHLNYISFIHTVNGVLHLAKDGRIIYAANTLS